MIAEPLVPVDNFMAYENWLIQQYSYSSLLPFSLFPPFDRSWQEILHINKLPGTRLLSSKEQKGERNKKHNRFFPRSKNFVLSSFSFSILFFLKKIEKKCFWKEEEERSLEKELAFLYSSVYVVCSGSSYTFFIGTIFFL